MLTMNWTGSTGVRTIGIATVLVMALTGCTGGDQEVAAEPAPETPAPTSAAASPSPSPEAVSEYSPEEEAAIEAAEAAVRRFYEVIEAAYRDPQSVGADTFDSVAIDPVRTDRLGVAGYMAEEGEHATGSIAVEVASVKSVETASDPDEFVYPEVYFDVCVDGSALEYIDASGDVISSEAPSRQPAVIGVYQEPGEGWLVQHLEYSDRSDVCE